MSNDCALLCLDFDFTLKTLLEEVAFNSGRKFFELIFRAAAVRTGTESGGRINLSLDFCSDSSHLDTR